MNRWLVRTLAACGGFLLGMVFTFGHQARAGVAGIDLPWGLGVALVGTVSALIGIRLFASRLVAAWAAAGLVAAVVLLSMPGPGGSVLVPANLSGIIWAIGPSLSAIVIVMWPASNASRR
ncbi:MAG TPA: hypothetical protein VK139_00560 [Microbacteriaceae bacterium]|nr:hypothetical protein [Microbacteriaceae bacterium]